ncbi:adenosine deaminase 2-like [Ctenocephalides felis]|uniref:adenosine deaminase 2-like n=1 Tax=Ctenocephalides felis TaxID=7515 RepID=UPI000E6E1532|nr:adenosine deaminase 2-like [Ctenocephalides felis]
MSVIINSVFVSICLLQLVSSARMNGPAPMSSNQYELKRAEFLKNEQENSVGGTLELSEDELKANATLMGFKKQELDEGFKDPARFPPARSFLESVNDVRNSQVFGLLKKMPKGAVLHGHDTALVSIDFVIKNITYRPNLYAKLRQANTGSNQILEELKFFPKQPSDGLWKSVAQIRQTEGWTRFGGIFGKITPMLTYEPVWTDYFYQSLKEFHEDNINYIEFRGTLPNVYRLDGTELKEKEVCQLYVDTLNKFKNQHPTFFGARFIYAPHRLVNNQQFLEYARIARDLKNAFPDFVAGFDLVGQEDLGETLHSFSTELEEMQSEMNFYFHAGETDWNGFSTDNNLVDAVLLGTKRIGHGYALLKHPQVARTVKNNQIGIEVCPISNQVLGLVSDLRNHPGSYLLTNNYPVVIAPDDPGFWGAQGASYDWYEAFMGLAAKWQDLRLLKQLAINSINYSSLEGLKKQELMQEWEKRWEKFVDDVNNGSNMRIDYAYIMLAVSCLLIFICS